LLVAQKELYLKCKQVQIRNTVLKSTSKKQRRCIETGEENTSVPCQHSLHLQKQAAR